MGTLVDLGGFLVGQERALELFDHSSQGIAGEKADRERRLKRVV
jgi:hypothetical protein